METMLMNKQNKKAMQKFAFYKPTQQSDTFPMYYETLSSKELDRKFNNDMNFLIHTIKKTSDLDRKIFIKILSNLIEAYIENKLEKEIDKSLSKILFS